MCNLAIWEGKTSSKRKRVGLEYDDSEFIWGDPDRPKETKPAKKQRKEITQDCADPKSDQESEDEDWRSRKAFSEEPDEPQDIESFQKWVVEMERKYMEPHWNHLRRRGSVVWGRLRPTDS